MASIGEVQDSPIASMLVVLPATSRGIAICWEQSYVTTWQLVFVPEINNACMKIEY